MRSNLRRHCGRQDPGELETGDDASRTASLPGRSLLASNTAASHAAANHTTVSPSTSPTHNPAPTLPAADQKKKSKKQNLLFMLFIS